MGYIWSYTIATQMSSVVSLSCRIWQRLLKLKNSFKKSILKSLLELENLKPQPDIKNQNLHFNKIST